MCAAKNEQQGVTALNNERDSAAATPTVVVISSNSAVENIIAGLKGDDATASQTAESHDYVDATDLTREQWIKVLTSSSVLKAWKAQLEGGSMHINRAPCAALALKDRDLESGDMQEILPEFEIADDTYVETRESKTNLEREMTLKAFTEFGIHAALSGGAQDIGFGLGGDVSWQNEQTIQGTGQESTTAVHGFYNFPRAILHLYSDSLKLSAQCERFFAEHGAKCFDEDEVDATLRRFYDRFGKLQCDSAFDHRSLRAEEQTNISDIKKDVRTKLNATIKGGGAGFDTGMHRQRALDREDRHFQQAEISRMSLETQGGNGLLASKQDRPEDLLEFLAEVTAGTKTGDQINALARHAKMQHKQNLSLLDVSVTAIRPEEVVPALQGNYHIGTFTIYTHLSQPSLIHSVDVYKNLCGDSADCLIFRCGREDMQEDLTYDLEVLVRKESIPKAYKLPEAYNVYLIISLEPFVSWGKGAEPYIILNGEGLRCVQLVWPDIELNPTMQWSLPISRHLQQPNAWSKSHPALESKPSGQSLQTDSDHHLLQGTTVPEKKSRNIFKKS
ncbi:MAG: hypothetical protein Q9225_005853 [Loekoesia sp. 1 TL-2023]